MLSQNFNLYNDIDLTIASSQIYIHRNRTFSSPSFARAGWIADSRSRDQFLRLTFHAAT